MPYPASIVDRIRAAYTLSISIETGRRPSATALENLGLPKHLSKKFIR